MGKHNFTPRSGLIALAALATLTLAACTKHEPPTIGFAPYDKDYSTKMGLAQVEYKYPIAPPACLPARFQTGLSTVASCCHAARAASSGSPKSSVALPALACTSRACSSRMSARRCGVARCFSATNGCCATASKTSPS
jgi:hypothetical protein